VVPRASTTVSPTLSSTGRADCTMPRKQRRRGFAT
jgi:hypothetical protein